jgi:hypothetical protein
MEPEFITYQKFNDPALAGQLAEQLKQHGVAYFVEEESQMFDPTFSFNNVSLKQYAVKIKSEDFEKVNQLLKADESLDVAEIGKDYYLYGFTDDELMDVIIKADEWSPFDVVLARKLLAEKGKGLTDEAITGINEKRIAELKVPDAPQTYWIVAGYFCAFCGGLLGIFIGWFLMTYKKTLPDGERVYEYRGNDRKHGRIIFYIGIVVLTVAVIYKLTWIFTNG